MRLLAAAALMSVLAGCAGLDTTTDNRASVLESGVFGDIRAKQPKKVSSDPQGLIRVDTGAGGSQIYGPGGDGAGTTAYADDGTVVAGSAGAAGPSDEEGAYRLNFENAEIKDVVHAVLGEALQLNYTLTPDVAGTITISSARPVGRRELLGILETTLAAQGFSMTKSGEVYKIGAMVNGPGVIDRGTRVQPGYGVSIVPLRFVSVRTMARLLGGFVVDAEGLRIDSTSNTMIIVGPGSKREQVVSTILSFDEDWMADQTVGIIELRRANPSAVVPELERVFGAGGQGASQGVVTFKPITRLKAVMVVSRNPAMVKRAETWIRRLDQESPAGDQLHVYKARYRDARELAKIASGLFGGGNLNFAVNTPNANGANGASGAGGQSDGFQIGTDGSTLGGGDPATLGGGGGGGADGTFGGEQPIDNPNGTGDGSDGSMGADGFGGDGSDGSTGADQTAPPDVLDLTTQGQSTGAGGMKISADPSNNTVIIYADAYRTEKVLVALQQLDVPPLQVAINVTIAEVRLNDQLRYGIEYYLRNHDEGSVSFQGAVGDALGRVLPGFNFVLGSNENPDLIVSALDKVTDVEILSSPSLMVLENQPATLQVGDQIPVAVREVRTTNSGNNPNDIINEIEYRDTGIILKVTPRVGDNGAVTLDVAQEISSVAGQTGENTPTISRRRVASNVAVNDGQTVVLAGLISTEKSKSRSGLPILSRIAGVGDATGTNDKGARRNELVVLIRPQIVRNGEDAQSVAEDLRTRMWAIGQRERQSP